MITETVVGWHHDSYREQRCCLRMSRIPHNIVSPAWVCVVMLSDASTMIGGETAIQCGGDTHSAPLAEAAPLNNQSIIKMEA